MGRVLGLCGNSPLEICQATPWEIAIYYEVQENPVLRFGGCACLCIEVRCLLSAIYCCVSLSQIRSFDVIVENGADRP